MDKQRTTQQNAALHLFFTHLAAGLNAGGFDMRRTLRADVEIPWNAHNVKEYLWRPIQQAQLGKDSTTELTTKDIDKVFDTLNRHLGQTTGVHVAFPSVDELLLEQRTRKSHGTE